MKIPLAGLGLRSKSLIALIALNTVTLIVALILGGLSFTDMREDLGRSFARSRALLNQQLILGKLQPELALAQRFADGVVTRRWLADENNPQLKELFFEEAEGYRRSFSDHSYFIASAKTGGFYHNDGNSPFSKSPHYRLEPSNDKDIWYYSTLSEGKPYNINIETDRALKATKVWFNVPIRDTKGEALGVAGSGLDLKDFLNNFIQNNPAGVTVMLINRRGFIQAHPNPEMIEYSSVGKESGERTLQRLLASEQQRASLGKATEQLIKGEQQAITFSASLDGTAHQIALAYIPELQWFVVSAVDLKAYSLLDHDIILWGLAVAALIIFTLVALTLAGFDRIVLLPLARLTRSVRQVASGAYDVRLRSTRQDELGELARTFDQMAQHVLEHTTHLEERVDERTRALREAHQKIDDAHRLLTDSIEYASLFQRALLPNRQLLEQFPGEIAALWLPRDVVGGDLYVYRPTRNGALIALMDCAGHGVPGAFMTMMAHAALDVALSERCPDDPAALLLHFDQVLRNMLPARQRFGQVSTDMDMALCHLDFAAQTLSYAGARIALHWLDHDGHHLAAASKRNIGGNKPPSFSNTTVPLQPGQSFYLSTDGFFDQNGGPRGFALGESAFRELIARINKLPLDQQIEALRQAIDEHRQELPQRDDISVLIFQPRPAIFQNASD